jgi:hypothetical protein
MGAGQSSHCAAKRKRKSLTRMYGSTMSSA